jgi:hypothetical protein
MAVKDVSQAVHHAARHLQEGMHALVQTTSYQPAVVAQLSQLAAAAAEKVGAITGMVSANEAPASIMAKRAALAQAALKTRITTMAAGYMFWFTSVLMLPPSAASSNSASKHNTKSSSSSSSSSSSGIGGVSAGSGSSSSSSSSAGPGSQATSKLDRCKEQASAGIQSAVKVLEVALPKAWPGCLEPDQGTRAAERAVVDLVISPQVVAGVPGEGLCLQPPALHPMLQ